MMNNRGWPHDINKTVQSIIIGSNSLITLYQTIRDLGIGVLFTFYNSARSLWYWPRPSDTVLLLLGALGREFVPKTLKISGTLTLYSRLCAHHSSLVTLPQRCHGPVHPHPPHPGRGGLPRLHVPQVCPPRVAGECRGLAEVLGRPRSLLPRGAPSGPRHQPAQLLLPYLPGSEVPVPGVVHAPSLMEWVRSPVQPSPFPTFQNPPQRD